jgi:CRISPR/Cas system type I-B associated protein Csh2 (Cas7 group RAMP superfamily)
MIRERNISSIQFLSKPVKGKLSFHIAMSIPKVILSTMHSGDSLPQVYPKKEAAATLDEQIMPRVFYRCTCT